MINEIFNPRAGETVPFTMELGGAGQLAGMFVGQADGLAVGNPASELHETLDAGM